MKNYRYYLSAFIVGCGCLFFLKNYKSEAFLVFDDDINYQTVLINNCANHTDISGEVWLGYDMANAFKKVFQSASMMFLDDKTSSRHSFGVQVYLRGYYKFKPPFPDERHINLAYVIYPLRYTKPDTTILKHRDKIKLNDFGGIQLLYDELQFYDALAVGSKSYAQKLRQAGFKAFYVPQFTNPEKFYYDYDEALQSEVLFVGNIRHQGAPVIALEHNLPITIYGPNWGDVAQGGFIDNKFLHKYYSSAKIVLNDHRGDMKDNGFINNRTFDVTACGTLLISDYLPEIEEIYGDSVPMWKTEEELVALIEYYLDPAHEEERLEKAKRAQEITLQNFTAKQIAEQFEAIIREVKKDKGID